jgi:HTH-type transcriptional repressor of NAD biosynthesis genes
MTRGLVLGKFAPLHRGHQLLIERSLAECDRTVVLVYDSREVTRVPLSVRSGWIRKRYPDVTVIEGSDAPSVTGHDPIVMRTQEEYIASVVPLPVTHFFSSEWYGAHVSASLGALDMRVDEARVVAPISATMIRGNPRAFSEWIDPDVLRDVLKWDLSGL